MSGLRGAASVVGAGTFGLGEAPGLTELEITAGAARAALDDAGLRAADVDGVFCASVTHNMGSLALCEYLGVTPKFSDSSMIGGSSNLAHVMTAAMAIATGQCDIVLVGLWEQPALGVGAAGVDLAAGPLRGALRAAPADHLLRAGSVASHARIRHHAPATRRDRGGGARVGGAEPGSVSGASRLRSPMFWRRAPSATRSRCATAALSPTAAARWCWPRPIARGTLRARPCRCSARRWRTGTAISRACPTRRPPRRRKPAPAPARWLACRFRISTLWRSTTPSPSPPSCSWRIWGFCAKGEGGAFVEDGAIAPGGRLAVNTNGGGLSCCHPGMYGMFPLIESVRQLRGDAGERQQDSAEIALAHGNGGVFSSQVTLVLGTDATL